MKAHPVAPHRLMRALLLGALLAFVANTASAFYNPLLGRFVNRDPIGEAGGNNLYVYTGNDAINHFDPLGLKIFTTEPTLTNNIVSMDKFFNGLDLTKYQESAGTATWCVSPNLKIVGSSTGSTVSIAPLSASTGRGDAWIQAVAGSGTTDTISITIQRPYTITRTVASSGYSTFFFPPNTYHPDDILNLHLADQFGDPIQFTTLGEKVSIPNSYHRQFWHPNIRGAGETDSLGNTTDEYSLFFSGPYGWANIAQTMTVGNWEANWSGILDSSGGFSGIMRAYFK